LNDTATAAELYSWIRGFVALKGRSGRFECSGTTVWINPGMESFLVDVGENNRVRQTLRIRQDGVTVTYTEQMVSKDTDGQHAWYITSLLAVYLKACFREREAQGVH
jgi:hypothetical protein